MKSPPEDRDHDIDDIFEYYLEELELDDSAPGSIRHQNNALNKFKKFLEQNDFAEYDDKTDEINYDLSEFGRRDAKRLLKWLKYDADIERSTANVYSIQIKRFVDFYNTIGHFAWNPIQVQLKNFDFEVDQETNKKEVELSRIKEEINNTDDPLKFVIVFLLLKWGIRRGELANVDLYDLHIEHPLADRLLPKPRAEIRDNPDTVYISSQLKEGHKGPHGEVRQVGNKRVRSTKIPIDQETKQVLMWHISHRMPCESPAKPLIVSMGTSNDLGERIKAGTISDSVKLWARKRGWNDEDTGQDESVHAHWCRHFFTTHMRRNVNPDDINGNPVDFYVKGLRGDSGDDVIDTYTHGWGDYTKEAYINSIYKILD